MFQVLIATTEDTVEIEMISEESPKVPCCATEGLATTNELPLSRAYQKFVARPTGVVGKLTQHESYRLCLSRSIDIGPSWQLPVYLAHWLKHRGLLYEPLLPGNKKEPNTIIWATGEVNYHLQVGSVGGFDRKLSHLIRWLQQNVHEPVPVLVIVPHEAAEMVKAHLDESLDGLFDVRVIGLEQVDTPEQIFSDLLLQQDSVLATADAETMSSRISSEDEVNRSGDIGVAPYKVGIFISLAVLSVMLIAYLVFNSHSLTGALQLDLTSIVAGSNTAASLPDEIVLEMYVEQHTGKSSCFSMTEARVPFRESHQEITRPILHVLNLEADDSACRITLLVHNRGTENYSALLMPANDSFKTAYREGVLPIHAGGSRTVVLLDRTELGGMRRSAGPLMRLFLAPVSTDTMKAFLDNILLHGDPMASSSISDSDMGNIWMRDVQAKVVYTTRVQDRHK